MRVARLVRALGVGNVQFGGKALIDLGPLFDQGELVGLKEDLVLLEVVRGGRTFQTGVAVAIRKIVEHFVPRGVDLLEPDDVGGLFDDRHERLRGSSALPAFLAVVNLDVVTHHGDRAGEAEFRDDLALPVVVGAVLGRAVDRHDVSVLGVARVRQIVQRRFRSRDEREGVRRLGGAQDGAADLHVGGGGILDGVVLLRETGQDAVEDVFVPVGFDGGHSGFDDPFAREIDRAVGGGRGDQHADLDVLFTVGRDQGVVVGLVDRPAEADTRRVQRDACFRGGLDRRHAVGDRRFGYRRQRRCRRGRGLRLGVFFGREFAPRARQYAKECKQQKRRQANAQANSVVFHLCPPVAPIWFFVRRVAPDPGACL